MPTGLGFYSKIMNYGNDDNKMLIQRHEGVSYHIVMFSIEINILF